MLVLPMLILMFEVPSWCRVWGCCSIGVVPVDAHARNPHFIYALVGITIAAKMMVPNAASSKMFLAQIVSVVVLDPG